MPNTFAFLVLFSWPLVVVFLFRSMPLPKALCWSLIAGYLLLPQRTGFNLPMLPTIDKNSVPSLAALVMCLGLAYRDRLQEAWRGRGGGMGAGALLGRLRSVPRQGGAKALFYALLAIVFVAPIATVLTNREPLFFGPRVLPGLTFYDMGNMVQGAIMTMIPFMLAMRFLATSARHVILLRTLVLAGLAYSLLMLVEIRLSPQLNTWIYGFFQHSWSQHARALGWRPIVFLNHGLWVGIFIATATLAACVLWRQSLRDRIAATPWSMAALWLALVLVLSSNFGATALVILLAPVVLLAPPRVQILVAAVIAGSVLLFPMLRSAGFVPTDAAVSTIARIAPTRAASLQFRFNQEDRLLDRASLKPLAGWGPWGRNRIFDENTGRDVTVTDGAWIIFIGRDGWIGYIARFGLLTIPIILLALRRRDQLTPATSGLSLVSAAGLMDLIPNATITPVTLLVAGALTGRYLHEERLIAASKDQRRQGPASAKAMWAGPLPGGIAPAGPSAAALAPAGWSAGSAGTPPGPSAAATGPGTAARPHVRRNRTATPAGPVDRTGTATPATDAAQHAPHRRSPRGSKPPGG